MPFFNSNAKVYHDALKKVTDETDAILKNYSGQVVDLKKISNETPQNAQSFYDRFGWLRHDRTREPVKKLAFYQTKYWNWGFRYKYRLSVKSQKVGLSTSCLMEDFQKTVLPPTNPWSTMGYQTLIISQSEKKALEHMTDLIRMIKQSDVYRPFLIERPDKKLLSTQVTKQSVIYLRNPWNPLMPSEIVALGSNPGAVWSFKRVKHIHMSDPAAINKLDDAELYDAAFSRLAITLGTFNIESPPRGQRGQLWEIYKRSKLKIDEDDPEKEQKEMGKFKVIEIPYDHAIQAGVFDDDFIIGERERFGPRFGQYYECEFLNPFNTWYDDSNFFYDDTIQLGS